jgi:hypothetical protein
MYIYKPGYVKAEVMNTTSINKSVCECISLYTCNESYWSPIRVLFPDLPENGGPILIESETSAVGETTPEEEIS